LQGQATFLKEDLVNVLTGMTRDLIFVQSFRYLLLSDINFQKLELPNLFDNSSFWKLMSDSSR